MPPASGRGNRRLSRSRPNILGRYSGVQFLSKCPVSDSPAGAGPSACRHFCLVSFLVQFCLGLRRCPRGPPRRPVLGLWCGEGSEPWDSVGGGATAPEPRDMSPGHTGRPSSPASWLALASQAPYAAQPLPGRRAQRKFSSSTVGIAVAQTSDLIHPLVCVKSGAGCEKETIEPEIGPQGVEE